MNTSRRLTAVAACALLIVGSAAAAPRMTISELNFNFGYVPQNSHVSHVFWLRSTGDDTLKILKVVPGCGCTKAPLDKEALAVGDSARLEIIFGSGQYQGHVAKRPKIETNVGAPDQFVEFTCNVIMKPDSTYPVIIKPYKLDLSQFGEKVRDKMTFRINNVSDQPLDLTLIAAPSDYVSITLPKSIPAGASADATITLAKAAVDKEFEKSFTFEVSNDNHDRFTVPIKRSLRAPGQTSAPVVPATQAGGH